MHVNFLTCLLQNHRHRENLWLQAKAYVPWSFKDYNIENAVQFHTIQYLYVELNGEIWTGRIDRKSTAVCQISLS